MFMTRRPLTSLSLGLAALAIGFLVLRLVMPDDYTRRQLGRALERETGIALEQVGSIRLALFPRLGIVLEQVTLRMPGLADIPPVTAERLVADVDPWALFERRLRLERLRVEKPAILFHVNAAGRRNWDFGKVRQEEPKPPRVASLGDATPPPTEAKPPRTPTLRSRTPRLPTAAIEIEGGTFTYLDEASPRRIELADTHLTLTSSRADGTAALDGRFRLYGEEVSAHALLREQISLSEASSPLRVEIASRAGSAIFDGAAAWKGERSARGQLRLDLKSAAALTAWIGEVRALAGLERASLGGTLLVDERHAALSAGRLQAGAIAGDLDGTLDFDGRARLDLLGLDLHGGRATGRLTVDARQGAAAVAGLFEMSDVDAMPLLQGLSGFDWLSGRSAARLSIAGSGESLAAVLSTLSGEGSLTVTGGAVEGLDLPKLIAQAREGAFKPWRRRPGERTRFDSLIAPFTLDKGIARSRDIALAGPEIAATGEGEASIPAHTLDYRLKVKVKATTEEERAKAEDGQVEIPLIVRGPWDKPDIYPDLDKVLRDPKAMGDVGKALGKSVEKLTEGKIKSEDVGKVLDSLFGGKKKKSE